MSGIEKRGGREKKGKRETEIQRKGKRERYLHCKVHQLSSGNNIIHTKKKQNETERNVALCVREGEREGELEGEHKGKREG